MLAKICEHNVSTYKQTSTDSRLLDIDLHTAFLARRAASRQLRKQVGDVVPRMPVQTSAQSLLVQEMGNETDRATEYEQTVEHTHLEVVFRLFRTEGAAVPEQVDEADGDAAVDVEDQVVLLGGSDGLDGDGVVEELGVGEVGLAELLDEGNAEIGVVAGLDTVTDTRDWEILAIAPS